MEQNSENIKKTLNVMDYILIFIRNLKFIFLFVIISLLIGMVLLFLKPKQYVSSSKTIHKYSKSQITNFNPSSVRSNTETEIVGGDNISLQGSENYFIDGLPHYIISEIVRSNTFLMEIAYDKCIPFTPDSLISFIEYSRNKKVKINILKVLKKYTLGLPRIIISKFKKDKQVYLYAKKESSLLTNEEKSIINTLSGMISTDIKIPKNEDYQIIGFLVKSPSPAVSFYLCNSVINNMKVELNTITTKKVANSLNYINIKFADVKQELANAEEKLAKFMDRNLDPQDARLKVEVERLKRKVNFISILYQDLQSKKTQVEINLQKNEPVFITITTPQIGKKESFKIKKTAIKYFVLGFGLSIIFIVLKISINTLNENIETSQKLNVIKEELASRYLYWNKKVEDDIINKEINNNK